MVDVILEGGDAFSTYDNATPSYGPATRAVSDVRRAVQRVFGDESGIALEDADVFMWINDACEEIVNRNKILKGTSTSTAVPGQQDYQFPAASIHQIESLHYDGLLIPNMKFEEAESQLMSASADLKQSGTPELWYEWGGKFSLWPVPASALNITLYYTLRPARVSAVGDLLPVPDKYYQAVVSYVTQHAFEMAEDWQASQIKGAQFDTQVGDMGEEERTSQNMTYQTITIIE